MVVFYFITILKQMVLVVRKNIWRKALNSFSILTSVPLYMAQLFYSFYIKPYVLLTDLLNINLFGRCHPLHNENDLKHCIVEIIHFRKIGCSLQKEKNCQDFIHSRWKWTYKDNWHNDLNFRLILICCYLF